MSLRELKLIFLFTALILKNLGGAVNKFFKQWSQHDKNNLVFILDSDFITALKRYYNWAWRYYTIQTVSVRNAKTQCAMIVINN